MKGIKMRTVWQITNSEIEDEGWCLISWYISCYVHKDMLQRLGEGNEHRINLLLSLKISITDK